MRKKIGLIHYRFGELDGASLQIDNFVKVLAKYPPDLVFIGANPYPHYRKSSYIFPEMRLDKNNEMLITTRNFFDSLKQPNFQKKYNLWQERIYQKLDKIFGKEKFSFLIVDNIFSLPLIPPFSTALLKVLDQYRLPTLAVGRDFWFTRDYFLQVRSPFIAKKLRLFPPKRDFILYQVLNTPIQKTLKTNFGIAAEKISDFFDYQPRFQIVDNFNRDLRKSMGISPNDLIVLQASRITPRKAIENSLYFVLDLENQLKKEAPIRINNKLFSADSRVVLLLTNRPDFNSWDYYQKLKILAKKLQVKAIWGYRHFSLTRQETARGKKYSFWDGYVFADIVTYPSLLEGFGNQLLETFYFKKPIVLFEYEAFKTDIKNKGFRFISFGDKMHQVNGWNLVPRRSVAQAAQEASKVLVNPNLYQEFTDQNYQIAKAHYSLSRLEKNLEKHAHL